MAVALLASACGTGGGTGGGSSGPPNTAPDAARQAALGAGASAAATDRAGTEWLCRPGRHPDPCSADLTTTVVASDGTTHVEHPTDASAPPVDCFYVYPTVSRQHGPVANLAIDPEEQAVAIAQAAPFSQVCRVYAPMYRQVTLAGLADPAAVSQADLATAFSDVLGAWRDYLENDNGGRGVVLVGHSQGATMLRALVQLELDQNPPSRRLLVSALLLGANVTVPVGGDVGGSFAHVPACRSTTATGCVVAYSSFDQPPPPDSLFGRPGQGVSTQFAWGHPEPASSGLEVLCVNPAAPAGGSAVLAPSFPTAHAGAGAFGFATGAHSAIPTPWVSEPGLYRAQCTTQGGATWLQVDAPIQPADPRPVVQQTLGPTWGLHLYDVNLALGNLVALVRSESRGFHR